MSFATDLKHSVRTRVAVVTLLIFAVSVATLAGYATELLRRDAQRQAILQQGTTTTLLAGQINDQIVMRLETLDRWAKAVGAEQNADATLLQQRLPYLPLLGNLFNGGLLVIDEHGLVSATTSPLLAAAGRQLELTPANQAFLNQLTAAAVVQPALGALHQLATVSLVAPLPATAGGPRRWMVAAVGLQGDNFLKRLGNGLSSGQGGRFLLLSDTLKSVVLSSDALTAPTEGGAASVKLDITALKTAGSGTLTLRDADGAALMVSIAAVPAARWRLATFLPMQEVYAPIVLAQQRLWLVAALLTLLAGALIWLLLRHQFMPLVTAAQALTDAADLRSLPESLPQTGSDEVGVLLARMRRLLEQLRAREQALDTQTDELTQINQQLQAILQHVPQLVWLKDLQGRYITCNAPFEAFFDLPVATVMGRTDEDFFMPEQARIYREDDQRCLQSHSMTTAQRWLQSARSVHPVLLEVNKIALHDALGRPQAILGIGQDMTERWRMAQFEQLRSNVLELLVMDAPLPKLLQTLTDGLHAMQSEWSCALMLVQDAGPEQRLRMAASAGLKSAWIHYLEEMPISTNTCSCALAAATGRRVVVADIAGSDASVTYRDQARQAGVGSCWSQPMKDAHGRVVGVFSVYQLAARGPDDADLQLLLHLANLAEIALDRAHAGERLRASEAGFRALTENTPEAVLVHRHGKILYANPAAVRLFGAVTATELEQKPAQDLIAPEFWPQHQARILSIEAGQPVQRCVESRFLRLDGRAIDVEVQGTAVMFDGAAAVHVSVRDVTQRNETRRQLQLAASVFEHALEGILITDAQSNIVDVNASFSRITGYSRDEVLGRNPRLLQSGRHGAAFYRQMWSALLRDGAWSGEMCNRRKDGRIYMQLLHISTVRDAQGVLLQCVGLLSDITARKSQEERLNHLAHFDALTGLPNRILHADRLRQAMATVMRRHKKLGVAFVDLDGFKAVNDGYGHDAGDHVLVTLAKRMRQALREVDTLSRIGGDEFAAIIVDLEYESDCDPLLQRLLGAANEPVPYNGHQLQVSASVGVTFYPQAQGISADQLLQQADLAMYRAKHRGKNQVQVSGFSDLADF